MPSPKFDDLHLKLARTIGDVSVGAATLDGEKLQSALRSDFLNRASAFIAQRVWQKSRIMPGAVDIYLQGLIKTQEFTFATAGTAVASDYVYPVSCQKEATGSQVRPTVLRWFDGSRKNEVDAKVWLYDDSVFTVLAGNIYGYIDGTQLDAVDGTLYYVKSEPKTAGDTTDITIDPVWHDRMVEIATTYFDQRTGKVTPDAAEAARAAIVDSVLT
jgi:hypothetical protein